ncbi:MAG: hypothetical protein QCH99_06170 [Candidatus Bathyarchaeota archaeon]|nr:hypothetical protein [Candidatus Bathyarchaeum tardum]WGM89772.1 MAG: hypothetical protein NUK63_01205 [Candidatus Bathyarchaeum tardum]
MTCYFRHLNALFEKAEIQVTKENKKDIDKTIHSIVGVQYKNCSETWKEVKKKIAENEENFVNKLKKELART